MYPALIVSSQNYVTFFSVSCFQFCLFHYSLPLFIQQFSEVFHSYAVVEVLGAVQSGVVDSHELRLQVDDRRAAAAWQCGYGVHQSLFCSLAYGAVVELCLYAFFRHCEDRSEIEAGHEEL